jgi:N-acetylglucosaminyldiphosphoundecaprenol N-acetyl-beta-D-mannosaminyltransferase
MDTILGVKIDNLDQKTLLQKVEAFLIEEKFHQINTVNPEFILEAQKNPEFRTILNNSALNIADGMGIKLAFWRYGKNLQQRLAGIDLMQAILEIAAQKKLEVFLIANQNGLSSWEETAEAINKKFPNLNPDGINLDPHNSAEIQRIKNSELKASRYKLIFCAFGAPQQEIFLNSLKNDILGIAMGVGGSFDFLTGKIKRAPVFVRKIGLEWLWRLAQEPKYRLKRIFRATIIFPIKIIFSKK